MNKTITIQIGNSDNKLTQAEWANFVGEIRIEIDALAEEVFFAGGSPSDSRWQNFAIVFSPGNSKFERKIRSSLIEIRKRYKQDSVAWTEGETEFI